MFDVGWSELLVIGVVALIVVGPKDLPVMFRTLGRFTAKARGMAREFTRAMNDAARESGLDEVSKDLKSMTSAKSMGLDKLQEAAGKFEAWDPLKKPSAATAKAKFKEAAKSAVSGEKAGATAAKAPSSPPPAAAAPETAIPETPGTAAPAAEAASAPAPSPQPAPAAPAAGSTDAQA